jgi:hypothetical protein
MKYYKDKYELPLYNWLMIQEKGFDLSYLAKNPQKIRKKDMKVLNDTYMSILYSLSDLGSELLYYFLKWQALLMQLRAELQIKKQPVIKDLEETFREYLKTLQKFYKDFEFTEYYFKQDYKEYLEKITKEVKDKKVIKDIKRIFIDLSNIKFYTWDEYYLYIAKHELIQKYTVIYTLLLTDIFKNEFIKERTVKFNNLVEVDIYLYDIYEEAGNYYKYQFLRHTLFNMYDLKSENRSQFNAFDEIVGISDILGYQIDSKKTTLAEWESLKNRAKSKVEANNKPNAA